MSIEAFRAGMESADLGAVAATLAPDVALHSPITRRHTFRGREEVLQVLGAVAEQIDQISYGRQLDDGSTSVVFGTGVVRGQPISEVTLFELGEDGLIAAMTLYVRPMPGLLALAASLAPHVGPSRRRSRIAGAMVLPLAAAAKTGEALAARLVWPR